MSGHLIGCVKPVDDGRFTPTHKLALLAFADSADDRTHIAFPGYEGIQDWALCSRRRAAEVIADLVTWGYLEQHKRGHRGQRAEYIVFPDGCCDLHRTPVPESEVDVDQIAQAAGVGAEEARRLLAALADVQPATETPEPAEKGSSTPHPIPPEACDPPHPNTPDVQKPAQGTAEPVDKAMENPGKGAERVHGSGVNRYAFSTSTTKTPLPPPASRQGSATDQTPTPRSCPAHPNGHANCRRCGTTPRQRAAATQRADAEAARRDRLEQTRRERETNAALRAQPRSAAASAAITTARALAAEAVIRHEVTR